jgi:hypothetical protein
MTFSEFFHDVTANIAEVKPVNTVFSATGNAVEPKKFINSGTRTGNNSAGMANGTPKWTETDALPKVDVISSATYGDSAHFVPNQNLAIIYPDSTTKADWHEVTGIKAVEVGVDFDLFANASLLRQAGREGASSAAVLAKVEGISSWKAASEVYKAKYLRPDGSWGKRDETAITEIKGKGWPKVIGGDSGATVSVSYGNTWADKIISVDFAPLPANLTNANLWDNYFDYVYGGYVEDLQTGHKEPLVWLQNLFSHKGHTNIEAAIQRTGFSRLNSLSAKGDIKVALFAQGYKDLVVEKIAVAEFAGQSSASIEQGSTFNVSGTGSTAKFQNSVGTEISKELHVQGLSPAALTDFKTAANRSFKKGTANVDTKAYELKLEEADGEIAITLKSDFFSGDFQGAYSLSITSSDPSVVYPTVSFTVNRIITRPQLKQGTGTASAADSANAPITVNKNGGAITFDNDAFAKAIVTTGRSPSSIAIESGSGSVPAIGTVLEKAADGVYAIKASALTSGITYKLTIQASNFVTGDLKNVSPAVYYIKVN